MLKAIQLIKEAKAKAGKPDEEVIVDLHPARPEYRGFMGMVPISLEADPSFQEVQTAGGTVDKNAEQHTVLDGFFGISGEIPRVTPFELGLKRGIRYENGKWEPDEKILDERFVVCNLKGPLIFARSTSRFLDDQELTSPETKDWSCLQAAATRASLMSQHMPFKSRTINCLYTPW